MGLFLAGIKSVDQILGEKAAQVFLDQLLFNFHCLTEDQVEDYFRNQCPRETPQREFHRRVRSLLHTLKDAGYLGLAKVERLPPITITHEPLLRISRTASMLAVPGKDQIRASRAAQKRVPGIEAHMPARLFCSTERTCKFIRSLGYREWPLEDRPEETEARVKEMVARHRYVEETAEPFASEIANSALTALVNLNQLVLTDTYRPLFEAGRVSYSASIGSVWSRHTFASWENRETGDCAELHFLGPTLSDEVHQWAMRATWESSKEAWWM